MSIRFGLHQGSGLLDRLRSRPNARRHPPPGGVKVRTEATRREPPRQPTRDRETHRQHLRQARPPTLRGRSQAGTRRTRLSRQLIRRRPRPPYAVDVGLTSTVRRSSDDLSPLTSHVDPTRRHGHCHTARRRLHLGRRLSVPRVRQLGPEDTSYLILRLYGPSTQIQQGGYPMPDVKRIT